MPQATCPTCGAPLPPPGPEAAAEPARRCDQCGALVEPSRGAFQVLEEEERTETGPGGSVVNIKMKRVAPRREQREPPPHPFSTETTGSFLLSEILGANEQRRSPRDDLLGDLSPEQRRRLDAQMRARGSARRPRPAPVAKEPLPPDRSRPALVLALIVLMLVLATCAVAVLALVS